MNDHICTKSHLTGHCPECGIKVIIWEDLKTFDEMYAHITENHSGFTPAQMVSVRTWMLAATHWQQSQHWEMRFQAHMLCETIKAHDIESLSCDRDGEEYCDCLRKQADKVDLLTGMSEAPAQ